MAESLRVHRIGRTGPGGSAGRGHHVLRWGRALLVDGRRTLHPASDSPGSRSGRAVGSGSPAPGQVRGGARASRAGLRASARVGGVVDRVERRDVVVGRSRARAAVGTSVRWRVGWVGWIGGPTEGAARRPAVSGNSSAGTRGRAAASTRHHRGGSRRPLARSSSSHLPRSRPTDTPNRSRTLHSTPCGDWGE